MNKKKMLKIIRRAQQGIDNIASECVNKRLIEDGQEALTLSMDLQEVIEEVKKLP